MNQSFDNIKKTELKKNQSFQYNKSDKTLDDIQSKIEELKTMKKKESKRDSKLDLNKSRDRDIYDQRTILPFSLANNNNEYCIKNSRQLQKEEMQCNNTKSKSPKKQYQSKPIAISSYSAANKQYLQWNEQLRGGGAISSNYYYSKGLNYYPNTNTNTNTNTNSNQQQQSALQSNLNDNNQNRIKTQINLFVKQLNYQNESNTNMTNYQMSSNTGSNITKKKVNKKPYSITKIPVYTPYFNLNDNNPDSIQVSERDKDLIKPIYKPQYKTMNEILKYNDIKTIKTSIYNMSDDDITHIPQEYIQELKELANLINSIL